MIVHAGANDVRLQRDIVGRQSAATRAVEVAQTDVQIFRPGRPVAGQREFDTAADRPSRVDGRAAGKARRRRTDVADRETAGDIRHYTAERITDAAAHGGEPTVAGAATGGTTGRGGAAV